MTTTGRNDLRSQRSDERSLTFTFVSATLLSAVYVSLAIYQVFEFELLGHAAVWSMLFLITVGGLPAAACFSSLAHFTGDRSTGLFRRAQRASWVMVLLGLWNFLMMIAP